MQLILKNANADCGLNEKLSDVLNNLEAQARSQMKEKIQYSFLVFGKTKNVILIEY